MIDHGEILNTINQCPIPVSRFLFVFSLLDLPLHRKMEGAKLKASKIIYLYLCKGKSEEYVHLNVRERELYYIYPHTKNI